MFEVHFNRKLAKLREIIKLYCQNPKQYEDSTLINLVHRTNLEGHKVFACLTYLLTPDLWKDSCSLVRAFSCTGGIGMSAELYVHLINLLDLEQLYCHIYLFSESIIEAVLQALLDHHAQHDAILVNMLQHFIKNPVKQDRLELFVVRVLSKSFGIVPLALWIDNAAWIGFHLDMGSIITDFYLNTCKTTTAVHFHNNECMVQSGLPTMTQVDLLSRRCVEPLDDKLVVQLLSDTRKLIERCPTPVTLSIDICVYLYECQLRQKAINLLLDSQAISSCKRRDQETVLDMLDKHIGQCLQYCENDGVYMSLALDYAARTQNSGVKSYISANVKQYLNEESLAVKLESASPAIRWQQDNIMRLLNALTESSHPILESILLDAIVRLPNGSPVRTFQYLRPYVTSFSDTASKVVPLVNTCLNKVQPANVSVKIEHTVETLMIFHPQKVLSMLLDQIMKSTSSLCLTLCQLLLKSASHVVLPSAEFCTALDTATTSCTTILPAELDIVCKALPLIGQYPSEVDKQLLSIASSQLNLSNKHLEEMLRCMEPILTAVPADLVDSPVLKGFVLFLLSALDASLTQSAHCKLTKLLIRVISSTYSILQEIEESILGKVVASLHPTTLDYMIAHQVLDKGMSKLITSPNV